MKPLFEYITKQINDNLVKPLTDNERQHLLRLDKRFWEVAQLYHNDKARYVTNIDEELKKFLSARKSGKKYFPILQYELPVRYMHDGVIFKINRLINDFNSFPCFISKYYLEILTAYKQMILGCIDPLTNHQKFTTIRLQKPSREMYELALQTIRENPYKPIDKSQRDMDATDAQQIIKDYIKKLGWKWEVNLKDNLQPRMAVGPQVLNINTDASFSEIDIEGLKAHEVMGHVGRRYYATQSGLYLMVEGMFGRNTLDEGLAVWNSLNKVNHQKPNILFNIALKTIIVYHLDRLDFCELFDMVKHLAPNLPDQIIFKTIVRDKRELQYTELLGGNGDDMSYFCGYMMVKDMSDQERDDILKYNIGPGQLTDLPKIKKFFELNKFKPLEIKAE